MIRLCCSESALTLNSESPQDFGTRKILCTGLKCNVAQRVASENWIRPDKLPWQIGLGAARAARREIDRPTQNRV